jgi:hypothetical protein
MSHRATQTIRVLLAAALTLGLGAAMTSCGPPELIRTPAAGLPRWEGRAVDLFDDTIDPAALGLTMEGPSPRSDAHLRERAQTADVVARVRVNTVTVDSVGDRQTYHIGIQVGVPTLTEAKVTDRTFELSVKSTSGAFGIVKSFDNRLKGQTFVGFLKRYTNDDGDQVVHWHLSADTAEVAAAVKEAVVLREISGS